MSQIDFEAQLFRVDPEDQRIGILQQYLANNGWVNAREIKRQLGYSDRTTRALAESSCGQILSGQLGYKLTCRSTPEEVLAAAGWLESQARKMSLRAGSIRRVWHAAGHSRANVMEVR